jgi:hypothetical protein
MRSGFALVLHSVEANPERSSLHVSCFKPPAVPILNLLVNERVSRATLSTLDVYLPIVRGQLGIESQSRFPVTMATTASHGSSLGMLKEQGRVSEDFNI